MVGLSFPKIRAFSLGQAKSSYPRVLSMGERVGEEASPKSFESAMTTTDLERLQSLYFILGEFGLTLASTDDRIHVPSIGSIEVYEEAIKAGLCFFLHPFVKRVMDRFSLSLA